MQLHWSSRHVPRSNEGTVRSWALYTCPRCGGAVTTEVSYTPAPSHSGPGIPSYAMVDELLQLPRQADLAADVSHLPEDVARFYRDARTVLYAGVPDAAAVQLRRTLEAAAAHRGVKDGPLFRRIQTLIDEGHITKDFAGLLDHVRKVGNLGAHATDERIEDAEVERVMRFTTQVLRNLFEVPGELAQLASEPAPPSPATNAAQPSSAA